MEVFDFFEPIDLERVKNGSEMEEATWYHAIAAYTDKPVDLTDRNLALIGIEGPNGDDVASYEVRKYLYRLGRPEYAEQVADLGNFKFNLLRYQQFRFGWDWKGDATHGSFGCAFSLLSGEQNIYINAPFADLYTAGDGTYMDLLLRMNVQQTDVNNRKFFAQNGMGLSTDFYYELPYIFLKKHGRIKFEVKDLGFIRWSSNSMNYSADSLYHYDGVNVADLFHLHSVSSLLNTDSIVNNNTKREKQQYTTYIPFTIDIHTKVFYGKHMAFEKGITWWHNNTSALPYYYVKLHFLLGKKKNSDVAYLMGYGGYGGFNAGVEAKFDFAKHYSVHIADNYLFSGFLPNSTGMGVYFKLVRKF